MSDILQLAGHFTAHAVWSLAEGETLTPIYAYLKENGAYFFERISADNLETSVKIGQEKLNTNPNQALGVILIYDGFVRQADNKVDALIVETRQFSEQVLVADLAIPYKPQNQQQTFKLANVKILDLSDSLKNSLSSLFQAYEAGIRSHEQGAKIWDSAYEDFI